MKRLKLVEYLKDPNREIITRDGKSVRILCTDRKDPIRPIIALVQIDKCKETYSSYTEDGSWFDSTSSPNDLFFAPEKHEGWVNVYKTRSGAAQIGQIYSSKEEAEMCRIDANYISTAKIEWEE